MITSRTAEVAVKRMMKVRCLDRSRTGGPTTERHAQEPGQSFMTAALRAHVFALEQDLARLRGTTSSS